MKISTQVAEEPFCTVGNIYQLFLPGFGHLLIAVLPQEASSLCLTTAFNRKVRMFILAGFIHHLIQLFRHMKAIRRLFSQPHWVSVCTLLIHH